jgi:hypothetical protein
VDIVKVAPMTTEGYFKNHGLEEKGGAGGRN